MDKEFNLSIPSPEQQPLLRGWLYLALGSLIIPGITAILLVMLRTISSDAASGWGELFRSALVIHVDLSVFVWFISIGGLFWTLFSPNQPFKIVRLGFYAIVAGTVSIALSPLLGEPTPLLNNYIPVLNQPIFFIGLVLVWAGLFVVSLRTLITYFTQRPVSFIHRAMAAAALSALMATVVLVVTLATLYGAEANQFYFEKLFWGAGHILQFTYTLLLLAGWKLMADRLQLLGGSPRWLMSGLLLTGILPLLAVPWLHLNHTPLAAEITVGYAELMRYGNGIAPGAMGLLLVIALLRQPRNSDQSATPILAALHSSLLLFAAGGILALFISGINTIIPAHYHGSIVGITLAFMGVIYLLLPYLGFTAPHGRVAVTQPYLYAVGQLMHIAGLALSGSEGAQRKTAGVSSEAMNSLAEQAGLMLTRSGGLLAVLGGLLFLVVCWRAIRATPE